MTSWLDLKYRRLVQQLFAAADADQLYWYGQSRFNPFYWPSTFNSLSLKIFLCRIPDVLR